MSATVQATKKSITLKGSATTVAQFFQYGIINILYQRGVFPQEDFSLVKKYGINLMSTSNPSLAKYLKHYLQQLTIWIGAGKAKSVVLAIKDRETHEVSERWHFNIQVLSENMDDSGNLIKPVREEKLITAEIASIIRQITATVSFLPELNEDSIFTILTYTAGDVEVPNDWVDADPHAINSQTEQVRLRSFSTNFHKVDSLVQYKVMED
ncbi:Mitotic spindle checkpoint component mad2 [Entomophthora muscae]|uniref:Mitotic spindle checkpoint component mad2 n=1 Tax=Entomophthora muscae TaxID=34485 RepID=A0ACC2SRG7_9FUNG|nr:Mitotic spindle checkpoint component mad2 [Entomophthora muscae]